jgi:predicted Zn-dependent peptidase
MSITDGFTTKVRFRRQPVAIAMWSALVLMTPAGAQQAGEQAPSTAGMVLKGKAPVSNEVLRVKLPKPQEATLPSGLHLMVLEDHRLPQIAFQIIIPGAGGYFDDPATAGLASYTAQMMREGTETRNSQQISQELERMAASVNVGASVSGPNATISGSALTENFDRLFALSAEILLAPAFPPNEWELLKERARAGLIQQRANPSFLASERYSTVIYGTHPAGRVSATPATLDAITRDAMVAHHRARYVPDHAAIAFAGDITLADARRLVESRLKGWTKRGSTAPAVADPSPVGARRVYMIARPNSVQTTLMVGTQSLSRKDRDYERLLVANRVLGGTMGRLFRHLREEKGYTYGIGSGISATNFRGDWTASTSVRSEVTEPALKDLLAEIADMRDKPIPAGELADAKRALVASFALSLESPQQVLNYYLNSWLYGLPADYWDTYPARISAVTAADAQAAAKKYWGDDRLQIVAVGDGSKLPAILEKYGPVEHYDTEGRKIGQ